MSPLPTIRVSGSADPDGANASGKTGKLPTIRIGGLGAAPAAAPGKTSKIPPIVVPEPAAAPEDEILDIVDLDAPADAPAPPAEPVPAPEPAPPAEPVPAPEPAPAPAVAPTVAKTGLRPGLKLPPRVGGVTTKRRVPVRTGAGLKLPPKPGAPKTGAAPAGATMAAAPAQPTAGAKKPSEAVAKKPEDDKAGKTAADKGNAAADTSKKPDDKGKADGKEKKPKKKRSWKRFFLTTLFFLGSLVASAWMRVGEMEEIPIHYDEPEKPAPKKAKKHRRPKGILFDLAVVGPKPGVPVRLVHRAKKPAVEVAEVVEATVETPVEETPAEPAPKKSEIVKRVPADLFEDALLETVKMLKTMPQDEARRSAVNTFTDIARKEMNRSRECYAVINALQAAQNWDDLVVDTIVDHPRKRKIKVGGTTHSIVPPFSPEPGVVVCNRFVNGNLVRNQRIALADMSPKEKLAILRAEKPDESNRSALFSRAFLELVHGTPKTFRDFVEKHKRIEGMKAFYVVYELERMK